LKETNFETPSFCVEKIDSRLQAAAVLGNQTWAYVHTEDKYGKILSYDADAKLY
jgi:hypothetical protein